MPSPPEPTGPRPPAAPRNYLAEEEARRRLSAAHMSLRRGQTQEAERAVQETLAQLPDDAGAHELLGDIRLAQGRVADALASYRTALEKEPGRPTAEARLARATLQQSVTQRRETLGVAYAASDTSLMRHGGEDDPKRRSRLAVFSAVLPGLGQIIGGEFLKGGIIAGVYALGWLLFSMTADRSSFTALSQALRFNFGALGGWPLLALLLLTLDWIYAVVDAAGLAGRQHSH